MYVKAIHIKKIRGLRSVSLNLERPGGRYSGITVITGENGSGKSTLLKAIAIALMGTERIRSLQSSFKGWITDAEHSGSIQLQIVPTKGVDTFQSDKVPHDPFSLTIKLTQSSGDEVSLSSGIKLVSTKRDPRYGPWDVEAKGWCASGYGPFRRLNREEASAAFLVSLPTRTRAFATLFRDEATLNDAELWLKSLDHDRMHDDAKASELLTNVLRVINQDYLPHGVTCNRVDSHGVWLTQPDGTTLRLGEMSDGYRVALALVTDILRVMSTVYGPSDLFEIGERCVVSRPGVVLIDELDAHLHPAWQRHIGFWLKRTFPQVQFIVTTHSPIICQAADQDGIFRLPTLGTRDRVEHLTGSEYQEVIAATPNDIYASAAFEMRVTRSPDVTRARQEYAQLKAKAAAGALTADEKRRLESLQALVTVDATEGAGEAD